MTQRSRVDGVIRIEKQHQFPLRLPDAPVAGGGYAAVGLMDGPNAGILSSQLITNRPGAVGGTIVHQQYLIILQSCRPDALDAGRQMGLTVIYRDNKAVFHHFTSHINRKLV